MPRSRGKISLISLRAIEPICFTEENWRTVEREYGHALSPEVRQQVTAATNGFIRFASAENTGTMSDAIKRATRLKKQAEVLISTINERAVGDVTREYVDDELSLSYARLNDDKQCEFLGASSVPLAARKYVRELHAELERFVKACDLTLRELDHAAGYNYWPSGGAWEHWIRQLTLILETHDLPIAVRKDRRSDKFGRASPFVLLVFRIQNFLSPKLVRSQHSRGALAVSIHKARRRSKPSMSRKIRAR